MRQIVVASSDTLPENIKAEMARMEATLKAKYGPVTLMVGTMLENMRTICDMIANSGDMSQEQRAAALEHSRTVLADVLNVIGQTYNVPRDDAVAVANAYRDFANMVGEELTGAENALADTESAALAVIDKAKLH